MVVRSSRAGRQQSSNLRARAVVAIPARDEAERLPACLRALAEQVDQYGRPMVHGAFGVVVFANNCSDDSAQVARLAAEGAPFAIRVVEARLASKQSHAGGARRVAMDLAEAWLQELSAEDGIIMTTDADSRVAPDWISANLKAFDQGAEAVLGRISLDEEGELLPPMFHARGKLESVYEDLLTELSARLDPQESNPWPHHATISGATLAVTREIYLRVGGLPRVALGEDKALVAALRRLDARVRFAPDVSVVTSARTAGRAPGGVADTLALRSAEPAALCDEALESCATAYRRALWRGRLRRTGFAGAGRWCAALRVTDRAARRSMCSSTFGEAWGRIESASPVLARRRLAPAQLPREIERAQWLLRRLQEKLVAHEDVETVLRLLVDANDLDAIS
jgi:GT2 family glycosyltransferase